MNSINSSLPSEPPRSWSKAFRTAGLFEGSIAAAFLVALFAPVPMFAGADNPLWFYLAGLLHFPSSLLFPVLYDATARYVRDSSIESIAIPCALIALMQFLLIAVLLKKPWRGRSQTHVV